MGRPKQSLLYKDSTLLQKIVNVASALECGPVLVVLGSDAQRFSEDCKKAITIINENWREGMAGSICRGLEKLQNDFPAMEGVIITVCDQPYVTKELLGELIEKHEQDKLPIIASSYGDTTGTPVFFHSSLFSELMQLRGDKGAKSILQKNAARVGLVNFPQGSVDIDTEEDYATLLKNELE